MFHWSAKSRLWKSAMNVSTSDRATATDGGKRFGTDGLWSTGFAAVGPSPHVPSASAKPVIAPQCRLRTPTLIQAPGTEVCHTSEAPLASGRNDLRVIRRWE